MLKKLHSIVAACVLFLHASTFARAEVAIPALTGPVVDEVNLLPSQDKRTIEELLYRLHANGGSQIAVLISSGLAGQSIEEYSIKVADAWKLGKAESDRGVLLLIVPSERKMRIEVGQGLEGDIPDAIAARIIDQTMAPAFRQSKFGAGILMACAQIMQKSDPELAKQILASLGQSPIEQPSGRKRAPGLLFLIFALIVLFSMFGGRRSRGFASGMLLGSILGGGGRGGRGGGFGGGGFGGGGGGFSGGGASGGW